MIIVILIGDNFNGVSGSMGQSLTVKDVLRFANHDFLNHLHLIKMNLDLGRIEEAKELINEISEQCQNFSGIGKIGLPKTVEFLQTLKWRYPEFHITLSSDIAEALEEQWDELIVQYLEETIIHVHKRLDVFSEQYMTIDVISAADAWKVTVHFTGHFTEIPHFHTETDACYMETLEQTEVSFKIAMQNRECK